METILSKIPLKVLLEQPVMIDANILMVGIEERLSNPVTFDIVVLLAYIHHNSNEETGFNKGLRSIYKRYCEDVIKRHRLPGTLNDYLSDCMRLNMIAGSEKE